MWSNTSVEWEQCQWNIPGKETWSDSLKRRFEVTWVPLPGSTFTHVTSAGSAQRQREHLKWCQSRTPLWLSLLHRPRDTLSTLTDGPCASCFICLTIGFPFKTCVWTGTKKPHVCHNPSRGRHLKSETLSVEWQLRYDMRRYRNVRVTMLWTKCQSSVRLPNLLFYCYIAPVWFLPSIQWGKLLYVADQVRPDVSIPKFLRILQKKQGDRSLFCSLPPGGGKCTLPSQAICLYIIPFACFFLRIDAIFLELIKILQTHVKLNHLSLSSFSFRSF